MKVRDLMARDPIVAEVPGNRRDVVQLLAKHGVSGLPVVKAGTRELAGVVTRSDILAKPHEEQLALVMTSPAITLAPEADVAEAARIFWQRRIHGIPIVEGRSLVGLLSPTELLTISTAYGEGVDQFITGRVVPIHQGTPLKVAWEVMRLTGHDALPVMDDDARLVGIVAGADLFHETGVADTVAKHDVGVSDGDMDDEAIRDISPQFFPSSRVGLAARPVKDVMVRKVVTVFLRSSGEDAARKMAKARVSQLPVVDADDRLVGIVTDLDLMRAWLR